MGVLLSARIFEVPRYQRAYAWEADEVGDYVRDLRDIAQRQRAGITPEKHFFGGLVSVDVQTGEVAQGIKYEVVDGQQRLATFVLTVAAIRDALQMVAAEAQAAGDTAVEAQAQGHATTLESDCLKHQVVTAQGTILRLRLRLSKADDRFFNQIVDRDTTRDPNQRASTRRLEAADEYIREHLVEAELAAAGAAPADRLQALLEIRDALLQHAQVIHIRSNDRREAYRLFSVLNDRGRSLSAGDLLRSHTLEILEPHPTEQTAIEPEWDSILQYEEAEVDQFLKAYFSSHTGQRPSKADLWSDVRDAFFGQTVPLSQADAAAVKTRVSEMRQEAEWLHAIRAGEWPYDPASAIAWDRGRLTRLTQSLSHDLCFPLLLAARAKLAENVFTEIVLMLERFVFRYISVVGASASKLHGKYISNAHAIRAPGGTWTINSLRGDLQALIQSDATDAVFQLRLVEKLEYGVPAQRRHLKYFLTALEEFFPSARARTTPAVTDKMTTFNLDSVTIEHIYPRNPQAGQADAALDPLKNDLGNLTFWGPTDNQAAGNEPFSVKKAAPYYPDSSVRMTAELAGQPPWKQTTGWTLTDLEARRDELKAMALCVFTVI